MCVGIAIPVAMVVATVATGGVAAYGQYQEGQSKNKYYQYLADQNDAEAQAAEKTAEQQTTILQNEAAQKSKELQGDVRVVKGNQKAAMAAIGLTGVTADEILADTTNKAKLDEFNIRYNADIQSWAAKKVAAEKGQALRNQATLYRFAGKNAKQAAALNMTGTLLGTATSLLNMTSLFPSKDSNVTVGGKGGSTSIYQGRTVWSPSKIS